MFERFFVTFIGFYARKLFSFHACMLVVDDTVLVNIPPEPVDLGRPVGSPWKGGLIYFVRYLISLFVVSFHGGFSI
jgi:hypothetical protein